jgi:hypothetical protein
MTDQVRPVPAFDGVNLGKDLLRTFRAGALATLDRAPAFRSRASSRSPPTMTAHRFSCCRASPPIR